MAFAVRDPPHQYLATPSSLKLLSWHRLAPDEWSLHRMKMQSCIWWAGISRGSLRLSRMPKPLATPQSTPLWYVHYHPKSLWLQHVYLLLVY